MRVIDQLKRYHARQENNPTEEQRTMIEPSLVIYHADCYDGLTAAWICKQALPSVELWPANHGEQPPPREKLEGRNVYIVDFSYPRLALEGINAVANKLVVLDHHKTAEAELQGLSYCTFDMGKSGAGLTWEYFFHGMEMPDWIKRVQDRDLWAWEFDDTAYFHAYMESKPLTIETLDGIGIDEIDGNFGGMCQKGQSIAEYIEMWIERAAEHVTHHRDAESRSLVALNMPYQNCSEAGHYLLKKFPDAVYSVTYYRTRENRWALSFRSRPDFDVSELAKRAGGGGHAQAAGATRSVLPVFDWIVW